MTSHARSIVMTGAAGRIGRAVVPLLPPEWTVRRTDRTAGEGIEVLDVADVDACRVAFAGADAVVHLAADPDPEAGWDSLLPANVTGAYAVARAAADCGVRRLVLASSLHAVSAVAPDIQVRAEDAPRPGNLYGATKAWAEAIGGWTAYATDTSVVALRIGYFAEQQPGPGRPDHDLAHAWLSVRDAADLIRASVEAEVDFFVANGISANRLRRADLSTTTARLGYRPRDDAWAVE